MNRFSLFVAVCVVGVLVTWGRPAGAEVLALVNYESKPAEALKAFRSPVPGSVRAEGLAVIDVDPDSPSFGEVKARIELPPDLVAHHIFYNRDASRAYVTALGKGELRVIDMADPALPMAVVEVADCAVGENVVTSADNARWYLTCMGSNKVIVGDAATNRILDTIEPPVPYPHGIAVHEGIDRILVTSTVRASDLGDAGDSLGVLKASTGEVLGTVRVSNKPSPGGEAPVEILFVPGAEPPVAYVTNMYGNSLWTVAWNPRREDFDAAEAWNFEGSGAAVPLEMYFDDTGKTFYVTTANPGHLHIFDLSQDPARPTLVRSIRTAEGAHHVAFNKDLSRAWVQNSFLNLPGMSDGSITVLDLPQGDIVATVDTLKQDGFNPNSIVLMPAWNHPAGH